MIYSKDGSAPSIEEASPDLVCDVVVGELHDVPCQVAHGVQRHGAVLEEMSACGEEKPFQSTIPALCSVKLENSCRPPRATAIELETNLKAVFFLFFFAYLATFLLDSLLPALDGGGAKKTGKLVRKSGEIEEGDIIC